MVICNGWSELLLQIQVFLMPLLIQNVLLVLLLLFRQLVMNKFLSWEFMVFRYVRCSMPG